MVGNFVVVVFQGRVTVEFWGNDCVERSLFLACVMDNQVGY